MRSKLKCLPILCCFIVGCNQAKTNSDRPLKVVVTGDTAGWIVPCGCASNQAGGLPFRGSYLQNLAGKAEIVLADAGGAPGGTSEYDRAKFEAILSGEMKLGVAAHNIGAGEAALGPDYLRRVAAEMAVPFVSANVRDRAGQSLTDPVRIVNAAGRRLALLGVLSEEFATDDIQVLPTRQAILKTLKSIQGKYDSAIVLAYLGEEELTALAGRLPEVDLVVGGPTGQSIAPRRFGPTLLASATNKGKYVAEFDAPTPGGEPRWTGKVVEMTRDFGEDKRMLAVLEDFYQQLGHHDFAPRQTSLVRSLPDNWPDDYRIAGTASCRECHQDDCGKWDTSKHAQAWATLSKKGAHVDSYCQQCHTTGYGLPGGFQSVAHSADLTNVGCESCHGPSGAHAATPKVRTAFFGQAKSRCAGCHDRENSPHFAFDAYWPKIRHGQPPQTSRASDSIKSHDEVGL